MDNSKKNNWAKKQVEKEKSFYVHLMVYLIINSFFMLRIYFRTEEFGFFHTGFWWGIGLAFHWFSVFGKNIIFGHRWEERRINKLMEEE